MGEGEEKEMKLVKTIYNTNLRKPDYYTVEVGNIRKMFPASQKKEIGKFISTVWKEQEQYKEQPDEAYIYYNIDWDSDHVLYCSYKKIPEGDYFNEDQI